MRERMPDISRQDAPDSRLTHRVEGGPQFNNELEIEDLCATALAILRSNPATAKIYRWLQANFDEENYCEVLLASWRLLEDNMLAKYVIAGKYDQIEAAFEAFDQGYTNI
jgi:hypothetical protein